MKRLGLLALAAGLAVLSGARGDAQDNAPIRVGINITTSTADPWYAADSGIFRKYGLNVTIQTMTGGAAIAAAVASGDLDVGSSNMLSLGNAVARGIPIKIVAPGFLFDNAQPPSLVMVAPNSAVRSAKDLNGKIVCGISVGGIDQLALDAWIDKNGGDSSTTKFVEVPAGAAIETVETERVAACTISDPYAADAVASKRLRSLGSTHSGIAPTFMLIAYFSSVDWLTKHPALAKRFHDAIAEASVWASTHPEDAAAIARKYMKTTITTVHEKASRTLDPALIQPVFDSALRYKLLPRAVSANEAIWSGVAPATR
jgi:NitT/TauT family transport system substrate-binding protein